MKDQTRAALMGVTSVKKFRKAVLVTGSDKGLPVWKGTMISPITTAIKAMM
jgi:hypothetical protein